MLSFAFFIAGCGTAQTAENQKKSPYLYADEALGLTQNNSQNTSNSDDGFEAGPTPEKTERRVHIDPENPPQNGLSAERHNILTIAESYLNIPYKYGGTTPDGFDCSGFTMFIYGKAGYQLSHDTREQFKQTTAVEKPKPGDLVFFKINGSRISHVGIYYGNNKMIHSPRTGKSTEITNLNINYWKTRYAGSRRVLKD